MASAGKHLTGGKRGKPPVNQMQARENVQPAPSTGKFVIDGKHRKTCARVDERMLANHGQVSLIYKTSTIEQLLSKVVR